MKSRQIPSRLSAFLADQDGAIGIVIALLLPVLFGFSGLAVDIGHMYAVNSQLKNAADAGALSGARALVPYTPSGTPNWAEALSKATLTVKLNRADNKQLTDSEVTYGYWSFTTSPPLQPDGIIPTANDFPAVSVKVAKTAGENGGPVEMYLASILRVLPADVSATSVAIISFPKGMGPGALKPLVATKDVIDKYWDKPDGYKFKIGDVHENGKDEKDGKHEKDDDTKIDEAMWTSFKDPANDAHTSKELMQGGNPGNLYVGDSIYLQPGTKATLYGDKEDGIGSFEGKTILLPIVNPGDGDLEHKTTEPIKGFIAFHITDHSQSGKWVEGYFDKDYVITNPKGGVPPLQGTASTSSSPQLVN